MKETKEQKSKKDYSLAFLIVIGIFVIVIGSCVIYALQYSKNNDVSTVSSNELYLKYISNMKKNINSLQEGKTETLKISENEQEQVTIYDCFEKIFEISNYDNSENNYTTNISVEINSNEEAYISFEQDTKLAKKYGNRYKLSDNIIQLFEIDASAQSIDKFIFMLKEDGTLLYINSNDLENGNIEVKSVNYVKNIVNIDLKTSYTSDINKTIVAIDIDGNMYELNNLIG